jgi:hypothetical protein
MGSTITPSKHTVEMAKKIVDKLNKDIKSENFKFGIWQKWDTDKEGTLRNYCKLLNKKYILLETSGQNNIQDIQIRKEQVKTTVNHVLKSMEII